MDISDYNGLRCNICRRVIGYTTQPPSEMLGETGALCRDCYMREVDSPT